MNLIEVFKSWSSTHFGFSIMLFAILFSALISPYGIHASETLLQPLYRIDLPGDPGSVGAADFDKDGNIDLAVIVAKSNKTVSLLVAYKVSSEKFLITHDFPLGLDLAKLPLPNMRDTSSRTIAIADFNSDGLLDIGTSEGIAFNSGDRKFIFVSLTNGSLSGNPSPAPTGILSTAKGSRLVRGAKGKLEICDQNQCHPFIHFDFFADLSHAFISELLILDFDKDGISDVIAGSRFLDSQNSYLWLGKDDYKKAHRLDGVNPIDIQAADINFDGRIDLVSQQLEFISDFPSHTQVFLNQEAGLELVSTLYNFDNHNDNAVLVRPQGQDCYNYFQIGVDNGFGWAKDQDITNGCQAFRSSDPNMISHVFTRLSPQTGIGIQCLHLSGPEEECQLVVRSSWTVVPKVERQGQLIVFPYPTLLK